VFSTERVKLHQPLSSSDSYLSIRNKLNVKKYIAQSLVTIAHAKEEKTPRCSIINLWYI